MTAAAPPAEDAGGSEGRRPAAWRPRRWVAVAMALATLVLLGLWAPGDGRGLPLDPHSPGPAGTKAVFDVARELGAQVRVASADQVTAALPAPHGDGGAVAVLLSDRLAEDARAALRSWVGAGGTVVVADPSSPLSPPAVGTTGIGPLEPSLARGPCEVDALADVDRVQAPRSVLYDVPAGAQGCFRRRHEDGAWLVVREEGRGTVVALGGPSALVNAQLRREDNALLAVALLTPEVMAAPRPQGRAATTLVVVSPVPPGGGDSGLLSLVPLGVRLAVVQLAVAFAVLAWWRARRLGGPVSEPQPVAIPASQLVAAVGRLYHESSARGHAAAILRAELSRALARRLGLSPSASPEALAEALEGNDAFPEAAASMIPTDRVRAMLTGAGPSDDEGLVRLAHELEAVRAAVLRPGTAAAAHASVDVPRPASVERTLP